MNNSIAAWIAAILLALVVADLLFFGWDLHVVVGRELLRVINWLAFWR